MCDNVLLLCMTSLVSVFFFFQAEDGIRDGTVTGVQTCALPISSSRGRNCPSVHWIGGVLGIALPHDLRGSANRGRFAGRRSLPVWNWLRRKTIAPPPKSATTQIGRASCRERV